MRYKGSGLRLLRKVLGQTEPGRLRKVPDRWAPAPPGDSSRFFIFWGVFLRAGPIAANSPQNLALARFLALCYTAKLKIGPAH